MKYRQYEIWTADLNPQFGTEPGKTRPVLIVQTNLLNKFHSSAVICPLTTKVNLEITILRINLDKGEGKLKRKSAIMIDQVRAIDCKRLIKKIGDLPKQHQDQVSENLRIILGLS